VLEHLHDPLGDLRILRRTLRPGGAIFIRVPNGASYTRQVAGRYWAGYDLPRHMTVFDPATLGRLLRSAGFGRVVVEYTSGSYLYLIHSLRFEMGDHPRWAPHAARIHRLLFHPILRGVLGIPLAFMDRFGQGAALEVLALVEE
jgi:predicted SAM-dependent methyltransferase